MIDHRLIRVVDLPPGYDAEIKRLIGSAAMKTRGRPRNPKIEQAVVERLENGEKVGDIARALGVHRNSVGNIRQRLAPRDDRKSPPDVTKAAQELLAAVDAAADTSEAMSALRAAVEENAKRLTEAYRVEAGGELSHGATFFHNGDVFLVLAYDQCYMMDDSGHMLHLPIPKTRGEFHRLLAALGIEK